VADTYGWVLYQSGDTLQATRVLQEAVRRGPTLGDARLHLALALLKSGRTAEASAAWAEALRLDDDLATRPAAAPLVAAFPTAKP
jgi:Flp pilus assembly protein TadD